MKRTFTFLLTLCLLLSLCACGSKEKDTGADGAQAPAAEQNADKPAPVADTPAGYFKLVKINSEEEETTTEELEAFGMIFYLVLDEDGTGAIEIFGEKTPVKWDETSLIIEDEDDSTACALRYANDEIVLTVEGEGDMTFVRLTGEELENYKTNGSTNPFAGGESFEGEGAIGDYYVKFLGAEAVEDDDGNSAIRVWYDFTNNSEKIVNAGFALMFNVTQGGEDLEMAYLYDDVTEGSYSTLGVAPGYTIRCAELRRYDPAAGEVTAELSEFFGNSVTCTYDPTALPGAPADEFAMQTDYSTPAYMLHVPETGEGVEILGIETDMDEDGEEIVTAHIRFTNTSDEEDSFFSMYTVYVMQDGYGLWQNHTGSQTEDNAYENIAPGESIDCDVTYLLRGDSPVTVVIEEFFGDSYFGQVFEEVPMG